MVVMPTPVSWYVDENHVYYHDKPKIIFEELFLQFLKLSLFQ